MKLYETLEQQLKKEPNFVTDNGELKKWVVLNKAQNFDEELIELLLQNETLKEKFFVKVKDVLVFKQNLFIEFLEQKNYLNDSYTKYKNKVGLTIDGKYLKQRNEVALVWPFKDCILEGGQSREEDKREEIFFNEILAQDEITQLLEPKVLTNAKRIDKDGEKPLDQFNRNENGTITDNLIIKGNNLLALHTLKKEFAGKIKLIYIDPPYNTGNDSFQYNDSFNESTWLTFMKNRLEVARELLRDDGVIFVQCDDNEQAYLKVLMDEVFGRDNFVSNVVWKGRGGRQDSKFIAQIHETIIFFSKKSQVLTLNKKIIQDKQSYPFYDEKRKLNYKLQLVRKWGSNSKKEDRPNLFYEVNFEGEKILPILPDGCDGCWRWSKRKLEQAIKNDLIVKDKKNGRTELYEKIFESNGTKGVTFTSWIDESFSGNAVNHNKELFGYKNFDYPKPEGLLKIILDMATQPNDIILDYHLGSGTTAAVAHKMGRQYIGIEQMDYIETVAVERLKKVIGKRVPIEKNETIQQELSLVSEPGGEYYKLEYDKGGISKSVNWQGGGEFVYLELKKYNQTFMEQIEVAKDTEALLQIWEQMKAKAFFKYSIDLQEFEKNLDTFKQFTLAMQKETLAQLLDKNQLYVNLSSLNDTDFACTEEEKKVSKDFYQMKS